ncbi:MAG: tRNA dihydrouridine synthase DusB [Tissierellia bacterium]|nr:tRNA dihydrouridine synthase DusB [Tissierellia bacterium]
MEIGNHKLHNNLILAPMAGFTDIAFRKIVSEMGAGLLVTEMVSAKGIYYKDPKTHILTQTHPKESSVALQIFGSDPKIISEIVKNNLNNREDIDLIDINLGCPAPKIVKNGEGSALMKNPKLVANIFEQLVKSSKKPVTAKIRMGWDKESVNGIEIAKIAENTGILAITIHARTRDMFYSGEADWDYIKELKASVNIPVIGNGDIYLPKDAINMLEQTACDGVAIGRGAIGNPWIFKRILRLLNDEEDLEPSFEEIIHMAIYHLHLGCDIKGDRIGVREMRKQIAAYLKGLKGSSVIRNKINTMWDKEEIENLLLEYNEYLKNSN